MPSSFQGLDSSEPEPIAAAINARIIATTIYQCQNFFILSSPFPDHVPRVLMLIYRSKYIFIWVIIHLLFRKVICWQHTSANICHKMKLFFNFLCKKRKKRAVPAPLLPSVLSVPANKQAKTAWRNYAISKNYCCKAFCKKKWAFRFLIILRKALFFLLFILLLWHFLHLIHSLSA